MPTLRMVSTLPDESLLALARNHPDPGCGSAAEQVNCRFPLRHPAQTRRKPNYRKRASSRNSAYMLEAMVLSKLQPQNQTITSVTGEQQTHLKPRKPRPGQGSSHTVKAECIYSWPL